MLAFQLLPPLHGCGPAGQAKRPESFVRRTMRRHSNGGLGGAEAGESDEESSEAEGEEGEAQVFPITSLHQLRTNQPEPREVESWAKALVVNHWGRLASNEGPKMPTFLLFNPIV